MRYHTPERPVATVAQVYRLADAMPARFRALTLPGAAVAALKPHMLQQVAAGADALVFTGDKGAMLRTGNFGRAVKWKATIAAVGLPEGFHFHDLRHTGNNLAASTGASTRELMHRMGTPACGRR